MPIELLSPAYCAAMNVLATKGAMRRVWVDADIRDWLLMLDAGGEL